jgi:8-oxo-dGTP pyrophosphatase MutT (NUDIX family)
MKYTSYRNIQKEPSESDTIIDRSGIWIMVVDPEDRVLISHPQYDASVMELPGGGIELGEDKKASLIREIEEEAGVTINHVVADETMNQHVKFLAWDLNEYWNYDQEYWIMKLNNNNHYFEGVRKTEEGAFGEWVDRKDIKQDNFHYIHWQALKKMGAL